jgi:hypothetical protein
MADNKERYLSPDERHEAERVERLIPDRGFIGRYVAYAKELTDAPLVFHYFTALSILGAAVNRATCIPWGQNNIYPNLWVILLAASTNYRKTTSLRIGEEILRAHDKPLVFPNEFTPESLLRQLSRTPCGLLSLDEFGLFLTSTKKEYMRGIAEILTTLYDCPPEYNKEIMSGSVSIERPFISILATSTIDWLTANVNEKDIRGGFLGRFMLVPSWLKYGWLAIPPEKDAALAGELAETIAGMKETVEPKTTLSEDAKYDFIDWLKKHEDEVTHRSETCAMLFSRMPVNLLKIALIVHIASGGGPEISPESIRLAVGVVELLKPRYERLLEREFTFTRFEDHRKKVLDIIANNGTISRSSLMFLSKLKKRRLDEVLETLLEEESIGVKKYNTGGVRDKTEYRLIDR